MFTGLIEQLGVVRENVANQNTNSLTIEANMSDIRAGESVAVNGVCLTVLAESCSTLLHFDVSFETKNCTNLGQLLAGDKVNLERAMVASTRMGGHYVSGHVDKVRSIHQWNKRNGFIDLVVGPFSTDDEPYLIPKGSICLNGVSLTINEVEQSMIKLVLVPHTLTHTAFASAKTGDHLNVEFDYLARVIAHQLKLRHL